MEKFPDTMTGVEQLIEQLIAADGNDFGRLISLSGLDISRDLQGVDLTGVDLQGFNLEGADLRWTILDRANLRACRLVGADLTGASLREANLEQAVLDGAILKRADLRGANLRSASLRNVDLSDADLEGSILDGTDFGSNEITQIFKIVSDLEEEREKRIDYLVKILRDRSKPTDVRQTAIEALGWLGGMWTGRLLLEAFQALEGQTDVSEAHWLIITSLEKMGTWEDARKRKEMTLFYQRLQSERAQVVMLGRLGAKGQELTEIARLLRQWHHYRHEPAEIRPLAVWLFERMSDWEKKQEKEVLEALRRTYQDRSELFEIRRTAVEVIGTLLASAEDALTNLRLVFDKESPEVRQAIANVSVSSGVSDTFLPDLADSSQEEPPEARDMAARGWMKRMVGRPKVRKKWKKRRERRPEK